MAKRQLEASGLDFFLDFIFGPREFHAVVEAVYERDNPRQRDVALGAMRAPIEDAAKEGYGEYRTHLLLSDLVAGTYNWNNNALMKLNEKMKDCLDPNGILAPGRNGRWPARYRGRACELYSNEISSKEIGAAPAGSTSHNYNFSSFS